MTATRGKTVALPKSFKCSHSNNNRLYLKTCGKDKTILKNWNMEKIEKYKEGMP